MQTMHPNLFQPFSYVFPPGIMTSQGVYTPNQIAAAQYPLIGYSDSSPKNLSPPHDHRHQTSPTMKMGSKSFMIAAILGLPTTHEDDQYEHVKKDTSAITTDYRYNNRLLSAPYNTTTAKSKTHSEKENKKGYSCTDNTSTAARPAKSKRVRTIFTPEQLDSLEKEFERQQYMVGPERLYLASKLILTEAQVKVWFQNRRIKWRRQTQEQQRSRSQTNFDDYQEDEDLSEDDETSRPSSSGDTRSSTTL